MKKGFIYKITSPSGKVYIGKTFNLKKRIDAYKCYHCKGQKILCKSLIKYGWSGHTFELLYEDFCNDKKLSELEVNYISEHKTFKGDNILGMNLTLGGEGCNGLKHNELTKIKISESRKKTGKTKAILESIEKSKGRKIQKNEKWIKNNSESIKKPIHQYDLNGNFVKEWSSAIDVEKTIGLSRKNISSNLRGVTNTAFNFIWIFKDSDIKIEYIIEKINKKKNSVKIINIESGVIYETMVEAAKKNKISYTLLANMLSGYIKNKTNLRYAEK